MSILKRGVTCLLTAAYICACAPVPVATKSNGAFSETQEFQLGTVAVVAYPTDPEPTLAVRTKNAEAGEASERAWDVLTGGLLGGLAGAVLGAYIAAGTVVGLLYADKLITAGAAIGTLAGAAKGAAETKAHGATKLSAPTEPVDQIGEVLARTLPNMVPANLNERLRSSVVAATARAGIEGVTEITAAIPPESEDINSSKPLKLDAERDTLLEVRVISVALIGNYGSLELTLHVDATMRMVNARTNHEFYRGDILTYEDGPRDSSAWIAGEGRLIKEGLENANRKFGRAIVDKIFLTTLTNKETVMSAPGARLADVARASVANP